jgi:dCMP deaminase
MRYATAYETKKMEKFIKIAAKEAKKSTCKKSQRGVVIVKNGEIIGRGYNKPTIEKLCNPCIRENVKDNEKVELCSAIHAEQMAIMDALKKGRNLEGSRMFHIAVKNGKIKFSEDTSCTVCSRIVLESDIKDFVLLHKKGFAIYPADEFNRLSFDYFLKK